MHCNVEFYYVGGNPTYRYRASVAAVTRGFKMVVFTASRGNNFVGGTRAPPSALLVLLIFYECLRVFLAKLLSPASAILHFHLTGRDSSLLVSCVFSSTKHHSDNHQTTSRTCSSQSLPLHPGPHCRTPVAETTSSHGQTGKRRFEHFPPPHRERGTSCRLN